MSTVMNYDTFEMMVDSYHFTEKQCYQLYRFYLQRIRRGRYIDGESAFYKVMDSYNNYHDILIEDGFQEEDVVCALCRELYSYEKFLPLKLLVLESVKSEKENIVLHNANILHSSPSKLYAKTRLWKDLNKPESYRSFMLLSSADLVKRYHVSIDDAVERYPLDRSAINRLVSRRDMNRRAREYEQQKLLEKGPH